MTSFRMEHISRIRQQSDKEQPVRVAKFTNSRGMPGTMLIDQHCVVFTTSRNDDIRDGTKDERRAWCRLTGMKNADLEKATKLYVQELEVERKADRVADIEDDAHKLGYKLVPL